MQRGCLGGPVLSLAEELNMSESTDNLERAALYLGSASLAIQNAIEELKAAGRGELLSRLFEADKYLDDTESIFNQLLQEAQE